MNIEQRHRSIIAAVLLTALSVVEPLNAAIHTIVVGEPDCGNCNIPPPLNIFNTTVTGSNFTMYDPGGIAVDFGNQPTQDIVGSFDDSKICFDVSCTDISMAMATSTPLAFQGFFWIAHDIRVFGPGAYTVDTGLDPQVDTVFGTTNLGGNPLTMTVGPGQLGAHMLFDWNTTANIDVVLVWDVNGQFTEIPTSGFKSFGAVDKTRNWDLASTDDNGNGIDGIPMKDGPFSGFHANFNIAFDVPVAFPAVTLSAAQAGNPDIVSNVVITTGGNPVTVDSGLAPAGLSFDWGNSDAALLAANTNGSSSATFMFDSTNGAIVDGTTLTARVTVTDTSTNLPSTQSLSLQMACPADGSVADADGDGVIDNVEGCTDSDGDGIKDFLDPLGQTPQQIAVSLLGPAAEVSAGTISIGGAAAQTADANGNFGAGIGLSASDIGVIDSAVISSCVGGCFDFAVTGGGLAGVGTSVQVVLPLTAALPDNSEYKKLAGGVWRAFAEDANNSVSSASSAGGVCPAPGDASYVTAAGLVGGNDCIQLTVEDNGPNDTDANVGSVADPSGAAEVAAAAAPVVAPTTTTRLGSAGGCTMSKAGVDSTKHVDLYLLVAFIVFLGLLRRRFTRI